MTEESRLKRAICDYLATMCQSCIFTLTPGIQASKKFGRSKYMVKGWPDLTGVYNGRPLFIEIKTPTGVVSPEQDAMINKLKAMGAIAFVARSVDDVVREIRWESGKWPIP